MHRFIVHRQYSLADLGGGSEPAPPPPLWATDRRTPSVTASVRRPKGVPLSSLVHTGHYIVAVFGDFGDYSSRREWTIVAENRKTATIITETIAQTPLTSICCGFVVYTTNPQQRDSHLAHSHVDLKLNHVLITS